MATYNPGDPLAYTTLYGGWFWTGIAQTPTPTPVIVTYSFPTSLPTSDTSVPNFTSATDSSFVAFSAAEQAQAISALGEWAKGSDIVFVQVAPGKGDINFSNVNFQTLTQPATEAGIGYNPGGEWNVFTHNSFVTDLNYGGDVFMNTQYQSATDGTVSYATLLHEIGHAIGLKHPMDPGGNGVDENTLTSNDPTLTIMSTLPDPNTTNPHLLPLDLQAVSHIYGQDGTGQVITATTGTVTGSNSVSSWSWNADTQTMTQAANATNDVIHGTSVNDVISADNTAPGHSSDGTGTVYMYGLSGNNTLTGSSATGSTDYLYGGPDTDTLNGGAGTNYLFAGAGTEQLNGGAGTNTFYDGIADSLGGSNDGVVTIAAKGSSDYFIIGSTTTKITESNATGNDRIDSTVSYTMPTNVDLMYLYGAGLTGTANNDSGANGWVTLFGDGTNATTLIAGSGTDELVGGSGNDILVAGTGNDYLYGGGGSNTFVYGSLLDSNPFGYISGFAEGTDEIDLTGIAKTFGQALHFVAGGSFTGANTAGEVISYVDQFGTTFVEVDTTGHASGQSGNFGIEIFDNGVALQSTDLMLACYCAGTRIMTEQGEVSVEDLVIGDRVMTASGAARPIKWIGNRSYAAPFTNGNQRVLPVCFKAGSLADAVPRRDLWVSPNHAMFIDGILIQAEDLVNGRSIVQAEAIESVSYFHIELESHDVILAEGAWSETFIDDDSRMLFQNAADYLRRYPDDPEGPARFCAPRVAEGYQLQAIRDRLARRGGAAVSDGNFLIRTESFRQAHA